MKKIALILAIVMIMMSLASCDILNEILPDGIFGEQGNGGEQTPPADEEKDPSTDDGDVTPPEDDGTGDSNDGGETGDDNGSDDEPEEGTDDPTDNPDEGEEPEEDDPLKDKNAALIDVTKLEGLNEQIYVKLTALDGFEYKVMYRKSGDEEFKTLDNELMFRKVGILEFYIVGISEGKYEVKIEAESESTLARRTFTDIEVAAQDRSGYAHFGFEDGIGAYNNDGTVKDDAVIIYVTNENKNTISLVINGEEQIGLVNILQKLYQFDRPVLIRVIGKISTNQWNYKNVEPRLVDGSNDDPTFFDNTFSNEFGTNLANLKVQYSDKKAGKTYIYKTTADGLIFEREKGGSTGTTNYKGSDFPALKGKAVYDDDSFINVIEVKGSKNITIEGIGTDAEFFQFGIGFEECNSIEIKNITFTDYPEDALNFIGKNDVTLSGNCWIHNNTFNNGYNAWDVTGERDKYAGDGSIDFAFIHNVTVGYNLFNECKKTMLVGNSDSSRCMNITIHHNHFYKVGSRLPLARNTNVHSYNNYFNDCSNCASVRVNSYLFSEANYFYSCGKPFDISSSAVKSYGDKFVSSSSGSAVIATSRDQYVSNNCKPNKTTNYSRFDTNSSLFYYDDVNGVTDVDYLLSADDVPDFVEKYAGAGVLARLENLD